MQQIQRRSARTSVPPLSDLAPILGTARISVEKAVLFALICAFWGLIIWTALVSVA